MADIARPRGVEDAYDDLRQARTRHTDLTARIAQAEAADNPEWVSDLETERDEAAADLVRAAQELDDLARHGTLPAAWRSPAA